MSKLGGLPLYALGYFIILQLALVLAIMYWPEFYENIELVRGFADSIPMLSEILDEIEADVYGYVAAQHFFKGCNTFGTPAAVLFAVGAVAGEARRGTLEILLARPQSRARVLGERYLGGLAALVLPVVITSATIPYLADQVDEIVDYSSVLLGAVHISLFLAAIYSVAFLFSTLGSNPMRIALGTLFVLAFCFALYMVKSVSFLSIFQLVDIEDFILIDQERRLNWAICAPLAVFSAVTYAASLACFKRRVP